MRLQVFIMLFLLLNLSCGRRAIIGENSNSKQEPELAQPLAATPSPELPAANPASPAEPAADDGSDTADSDEQEQTE